MTFVVRRYGSNVFFEVNTADKDKSRAVFVSDEKADKTLIVNNKKFAFTGGRCEIPAGDFIRGANLIRIEGGNGTLIAESITKSGEYISPSGITHKGFVLDLIKREAMYLKQVETLRAEIEELRARETTDDFFDIG